MRIYAKEYVPVEDGLFNHHQVLINIILEKKVARMAEIGVYKGRNMRNILRSPANQILREYYAVDRWLHVEEYWPGKTQADWEGLYKSAMKYIPWFQQLRIMRMESVEAAALFWDGFFDLVYIDGDHRYPFVQADFKAWLPKVKKGGIIAGHDYFDRVRHNHQVKPAVDDFFGKDNIILDRSSVWIKEL